MTQSAERKSPLIWIALFVVPLLYALVRQTTPWQWHYGLNATLHWVLATLAIIWAIRTLGGTDSIGLLRPVTMFVCFALTICAAVGTQIVLFRHEPLSDWQWQPVFGLGRWGIAVTAVTAGFCEEVIYRGYMMNALKRNGGGAFVAMALSSTSFVLFHGLLPFPMLIAGFIISMLWSLIYHKTGVLWINIFIHGLWDVLILLTPWVALFGDKST